MSTYKEINIILPFTSADNIYNWISTWDLEANLHLLFLSMKRWIMQGSHSVKQVMFEMFLLDYKNKTTWALSWVPASSGDQYLQGKKRFQAFLNPSQEMSHTVYS